jgi:hypothetical protein
MPSSQIMTTDWARDDATQSAWTRGHEGLLTCVFCESQIRAISLNFVSKSRSVHEDVRVAECRVAGNPDSLFVAAGQTKLVTAAAAISRYEAQLIDNGHENHGRCSIAVKRARKVVYRKDDVATRWPISPIKLRGRLATQLSIVVDAVKAK